VNYTGRGWSPAVETSASDTICTMSDRLSLVSRSKSAANRRAKEFLFCSAEKVEIKRWPIRGISYQEIVNEPITSLNQQEKRRSRKAES
ncbi:MAG: hypothetical protein ACREBD_27275, partial [Blastocatellia bacterium]